MHEEQIYVEDLTYRLTLSYCSTPFTGRA